MNIIQLKKDMRADADKHKLEVPKVNYGSATWGLGARRLAWRVSGHYGKATTNKNTLWAHFHPLTFGQLIVRVAKAKVGVHETGYTNTGRWVDIFLHAVYLPGGYAWCAAFAMWDVIRAAIIKDVLNDTKNDYEQLRDIIHDLFYGNAAYVPNLARAFREGRKAHGWQVKAVAWSDVQAGDIIICYFGGHVEVSTGRVNGGRVPTIGGNTSTSGSQDNGGEVCVKSRVIGREATSAGRIIPPR